MEARPAYAQQRGGTSSRGIYTQRVQPGLRFFTSTFPQTTIFGVTHPAPIFVAPVGAQGLMHNDGELGTARAAERVGVPLIVSSSASRSMEEIAEAHGPNGHRWYQLYWQVYLPSALAIWHAKSLTPLRRLQDALCRAHAVSHQTRQSERVLRARDHGGHDGHRVASTRSWSCVFSGWTRVWRAAGHFGSHVYGTFRA